MILKTTEEKVLLINAKVKHKQQVKLKYESGLVKAFSHSKPPNYGSLVFNGKRI